MKKKIKKPVTIRKKLQSSIHQSIEFMLLGISIIMAGRIFPVYILGYPLRWYGYLVCLISSVFFLLILLRKLFLYIKRRIKNDKATKK